MAKTTEMVEVAVTKLRPYERNAKKHGPEQVEKLIESINTFGFLTPCLIDREYNIIAGHGRVIAAKEMGLERVPCVFIDGLTEEQRRAYILADNRLGELGEWDAEMVSRELEDLRALGFEIDVTGFSVDDIIINDDMGVEITDDQMADLESKVPARVQRGDVWRLGRHRLVCGDSARFEDVQKLMQGRSADLLETDPPYGVDLQIEDIEEAKKRRRRTDGLGIENDGLQGAELSDFLVTTLSNARRVMKPGAAFYIWHTDTNGLIFRQATEDAGLRIRQVLIWVKNTFALGRQDYQWRHEPCLYGWNGGAGHYFIDVRSFSTVAEAGAIQDKSREELVQIIEDLLTILTTAGHEKKPVRSELHPTMKPLSIIKKQIRNSSREGELVLDLFGGSGTTMLAAEELGRVCYMLEYDPHYCDVILARWEELTGERATREEAGNE